MGLWLPTITSTNRDGVLLESKVTTADRSSAANISGAGVEIMDKTHYDNEQKQKLLYKKN